MDKAEKAKGTRGQLIGPGVIGASQKGAPIDVAQSYKEMGIGKKLADLARKVFRVPRRKVKGKYIN